MRTGSPAAADTSGRYTRSLRIIVCLLRGRANSRPSRWPGSTRRADTRRGSLRYDLSKLRTKGLVKEVPRSHRYRLTPEGYSVYLVFLKLFERVYAPLTAGLLQSISGDSRFQQQKRFRA